MLTEVTNARASVGSIKATPELRQRSGGVPQVHQARRASCRARCRGCWSSPRTIRNFKSDALFRDLTSQLEGTENRITVARNRYIKTVQEYNTTVRSFPTNLTAMLFKMDVKPNFTVDNETAISAPPKVDFSKPPAQPRLPAPAPAPKRLNTARRAVVPRGDAAAPPLMTHCPPARAAAWRC